MKASSLLMLGGAAVGGVLLYKWYAGQPSSGGAGAQGMRNVLAPGGANLGPSTATGELTADEKVGMWKALSKATSIAPVLPPPPGVGSDYNAFATNRRGAIETPNSVPLALLPVQISKAVYSPGMGMAPPPGYQPLARTYAMQAPDASDSILVWIQSANTPRAEIPTSTSSPCLMGTPPDQCPKPSPSVPAFPGLYVFVSADGKTIRTSSTPTSTDPTDLLFLRPNEAASVLKGAGPAFNPTPPPPPPVPSAPPGLGRPPVGPGGVGPGGGMTPIPLDTPPPVSMTVLASELSDAEKKALIDALVSLNVLLDLHDVQGVDPSAPYDIGVNVLPVAATAGVRGRAFTGSAPLIQQTPQLNAGKIASALDGGRSLAISDALLQDLRAAVAAGQPVPVVGQTLTFVNGDVVATGKMPGMRLALLPSDKALVPVRI